MEHVSHALLWLAGVLAIIHSSDGTTVSDITPHYGSLKGATYITIAGTGFAEDQFSWGEGNEDLGNSVKLVSETQTYDCPVHRDETHGTQVVCYTEAMPNDEYFVRVSVDGIQVPDDNLCGGNPYSSDCRFTPRSSNTPKIYDLTPRSGPPGTVITLEGYIFTSMFSTNEEIATNGRTVRIKRVYVGGQTCELRVDGTDELYGITLDDGGESDYGTISCKMSGTYIGNQNVSFIIDGAFGRSKTTGGVLRVTAQNKIITFQSYAVIDDVTPSSGSLVGGTLLTIEGNYFDETDHPCEVTVGGVPCEVVSLTTTQIVCETPPIPDVVNASYPGNRGVQFMMWNDTHTSNLEEVLAFNRTPTISDIYDDFYFNEETLNYYNTRMQTYFVPPSDNDYQFLIMGDDNAELYMSLTGSPDDIELIASVPSYANTYYEHDSQRSARFTLEGGKSYYMEVPHREATGDSNVYVAVLIFDTPFTYTQAGSVQNEQQTLMTSSTVLPEIQTVSLSSWPDSSQASTNEVQEIAVNSAFPDQVSFRLGLYGQFTGILGGSDSAATIQSELDDLIAIGDGSFTVSKSSTGSGFTLSVTFNSDLGDWPLLEAVTDDTSAANATYSVAETTAGVSAMTSFVLSLEGMPTPALTSSATADDVDEAISALGSVRCPSEVTSPMSYRFYQDYESETDYQESGWRTAKMEPFCGRKSSKNPNWIFKEGSGSPTVKIMTYGKLCFAYYGNMQSRVRVQYYYTANGVEDQTRYDTFTVPLDQVNSWGYVCWDMRAAILDHRPTYSSLVLRKIDIFRVNSLEDYYVDSILIGSVETTTDIEGLMFYRRLRPGRWAIKTVEVVGDSTSGFNVTMTTQDCAFDFSLLAFEHTTASISGDTATYSGGSWSTGSTSVTRIQAATPPVTGYMNLQFGSDLLTGIPADASAEDMRLILETADGMGSLEVAREGSCAGYTWDVTWLTAPGDQPPLIVDNSTSVDGEDAKVEAMTTQNGGTLIDPISGDMLRTQHDLPQVIVNINHIPTTCEGSCDFEWELDSTPTITAIDPITGSSTDGTALTITGTGFDTVPGNNSVVIGGEPCDVTTATATEIQCDIGDGPAGTHDVILRVLGKGFADHQPSTFTFTYEFGLDSINPTSGSIAGGTKLTVEGSGFGSNITVTIGGLDCELTSANYSYIECITPAQSAAGSQNVVVEEGSNSDNGGGLTFDYQTALTPVVTAVSAAVGLVTDVVNITISGNGFGASASEDGLSVGGVPMMVHSYADTSITAELPIMAPGSYALMLYVQDKGYADMTTNSIQAIDYVFRMDSVTPSNGSVAGGTLLTITGEGFSDDPTENIIEIGGAGCTPEVANNTYVECITGSSTTTHNVDNSGTNPDYGIGYAWNPAIITVHVGDTVYWSWEVSELVTGMSYTVRQTSSPIAIVSMEDGFGNDAAASASGAYQYQFNEVGTYYYWSEAVDQYDSIYMRGTVKVQPATTTLEDITFSINGHEAMHSVTGAAVSDSGSCVGHSDAIFDNCTTVDNTDSMSIHHTFAYSACHTPVVHYMSPTVGPSTEEIIIYGEGLSTQMCQNEVDIGGQPCVVSSASETQLSCTLNPGDALQVGVPLALHVRINNLGDALITELTDLDRNFILLPHVTSIDPVIGSTSGGTNLTISGGGFDGGPNAVSVLIDGVSCDVISVSYTEIVCVTGIAYEVTANITASVYSVNGQQLVSECRGDCEFTYSDAETPTIYSVNPTTVAAPNTNVTINGTLFGTDPAAVHVNIGAVACDVLDVTDEEIICESGYPVAGDQALNVEISPRGLANSEVNTLYVDPQSNSISPGSGSLNGGTAVTITGYGFDPDSTQVTVGGSACDISSVTASTIECITPSGSDMSAAVAITSNSVSFPALSFDYSSDDTPTVTSLATSPGNPGDSITITGTGFGSSATVSIGDTECTTTSVSDTSIVCTVGEHSAGEFDVDVNVAGKGMATSSTTFQFLLSVDSISSSSGSFGGGQNLTIEGHGFDPVTTNVTICGAECVITQEPTPTHIYCDTPANSGSGSEACDLIVRVGDLTDSTTFTYQDSLTPTISSVEPRRGGTGGGTSLTITGTGFGTDDSAVSVTIAGTECSIISVTDTVVTCTTGSHSPSIETKVRLEVDDNGVALQDNADFQYVDVWSSLFSWGGTRIPAEGDMVVIPSDMTILLDVATPTLAMLLIDGGKLIFDEVDVELHSNYILITNGGTLQVGTEDEPFQHQAVIELHGHTMSQELPLYGAKVLAVREGVLDLHGQPVSVPWTRLGETAEIGDTSIVLEESVDWSAGDEIAIATTGNKASEIETETRYVTSVSLDGTTVHFAEPLEYKHLGETVDLGFGHELEARAEVAMLSRNIIVRGNNNEEWNDVIEACPDGFDAGEFTTQTCFQGRFGEEIGSDMYGSHIILQPTRPNEDLVIGRFSYVEVTNCGQAFRLGRYAIHFHLHGVATQSYVRGCAIHRSFNRAVNIHGTHYVRIERNVIYDIMGGAFFLEDGIEIGNVFEYNLALFVHSSTSLHNDDITPAAYWITNANNTYRFNHAAGGTHFGFWYRMHSRPDGPSYDPNYCPRHIPMGMFANNTVHSQGWFGIWIFQDLYPMEGGGCYSSTPAATPFYSLTAWHNEKGAEWVNAGAMQFINFLMVANEKAGIEMKTIMKAWRFSEDHGAMIKDSVIVSQPAVADVLYPYKTKTALIMPLAHGLIVDGVTFVNFNETGTRMLKMTTIDGTSGPNNGGFDARFSNIIMHNSPNKAKFSWVHEAVFEDLDGTLTGTVGARVVPSSDIFPPDECTEDAGFSLGNHPGSVCSASVGFHRFVWNQATPASLNAKDVSFTNQHGTTTGYYEDMRMTLKPGWMALLVSGDTYVMEFVNADHITNISYDGILYSFEEDEYVIIQHNFTQHPDMFQIIPSVAASNATDGPLDPATSYHGDWYFDDSQNLLSYMVSGRSRISKRDSNDVVDRDVTLNVYQCYYADCAVPLDETGLPPPTNRPDDAIFWSDPASWEGTEEGWGGNNGDGTFGPPTDNTDVKIVPDTWMVADTAFPVINKLYIYGALEFEYQLNPDTGDYYDFTLSAEHIIIAGGRLIVGWEDNPFQGFADIVLRGNHLSEELILTGGVNVGAKAMGVFGGLDLHGIPRNVSWTQLSETAAAGSSLLVLKEATDWMVGDELVIVSTSFSAHQTEVFAIAAVAENGARITLNDTLQYQHIVATEDIGNGRTYTMAAEVGLLTRNVRIIGEEYNNLFTQSFGARILVGTYAGDEDDVIGYARIDNVQFYHCGQEGFVDWYDPRYALAWLNIGDSTDAAPNYIKNSAFFHSFSPAIGVYGTNGVDVEDNVVYHVVGSGVVIGGADNKLRRTLVAFALWPSTYNGRYEATSISWQGCIDTIRSIRPVLTDNTVAGCERMGFYVDGEPCTTAVNPAEPWRNNVAHSSLQGISLINANPGDSVGYSDCTLISNFTVYKNYDYGLFFHLGYSLQVIGVTFLDNGISLLPLIIGPSVTAHLHKDQFLHVLDSSFVGTTSAFDCDLDVMSSDDPNFALSPTSRGWASPGGGKTGLAITIFTGGHNGAPFFPFDGIMAYNAMYGINIISGVHFSKFTSYCGGISDSAITTNPLGDDAIHPVRTTSISFADVDEDNKFYMHRPRLGTINPADCVDMDCDGLKKFIFEDLDGTFLGEVGTIIPESEWEWDGDARRGLGDYRIPVTMMTDLDGSRLYPEDICPNKGILRDDTCVYNDAYQAWVCHGLDYEMMMVESLDEDSETRRLSPIAIMTDGYVDLINGPQDHGWCAGYTCQKRVSLFPIVFAMGKTYTFHYTGVSPQDTRLHNMNSDETQAVVLAIYYSTAQRLDVYYQEQYIDPTNAVYNEQGQQTLTAPTIEGQFHPDVQSDPAGTNYFDNDWNVLYVLVRGSEPVDIITSPLITLTFGMPAVTVDEFFGENLVSNLALFLGIPAENILIADAVSESRRRRRKRSEDTMEITLQISNPPGNSTNSSSGMSVEEMGNVSTTLVNAVQLNVLGGVLNVTILTVDITEPLPDPGSDTWGDVAEAIESGTDFQVTLQIPAELSMEQAATYGYEMSPVLETPSFHMYDTLGAHVAALGTWSDPWDLTATLVMIDGSDPDAYLYGDSTIPFWLGWGNFTNLAVSHAGNYKIEVAISSPADAVGLFDTHSFDVTIQPKQLDAQVASQPSEVYEDEVIVTLVELVDAITGDRFDELTWKNYTWTCAASLYPSDLYSNSLDGDTEVTFDTTTSYASMNMSLSQASRYFIQYHVVSDPADYDFTVISESIDVLNPALINMRPESTRDVSLKFNYDYDTYVAGEEDYFLAAVVNELMQTYSQNATFTNFTVSPGSIIVSWVIIGESASVTATLDAIQSSLQSSSFSFSYDGNSFTPDSNLYVDGQVYNDVDSAKGNLSVGELGAIVVCVTCVVIIAGVAFLLWQHKMKNSNKKIPTHTRAEGHPVNRRTTVHMMDEEIGPNAGADVVKGNGRFDNKVIPEETGPESDSGHGRLVPEKRPPTPARNAWGDV